MPSLEKWGEKPQQGSITLQVLHGADGVLPVTVPLNDSMASLRTTISAALSTPARSGKAVLAFLSIFL